MTMLHHRAVLLFSVIAFASACKTKSGSADAGAPFANDTLPVDANERGLAICDRLTKAGVAKACTPPPERDPRSKLRGPIAMFVKFEPVGGFSTDTCTVRVDYDDHEYAGFRSMVDAAAYPADDYPRLTVFSTSAAMWHSSVYCMTKDPSKPDIAWDRCRDKSPVAACSKQFAHEYARYKALHDAAVPIVDGR